MSAVEEYLATLDEPRRSEVRELHELVTAALPDAEVELSPTGGLGYDPFHYRYASGREGDAHRVSLVARKAGISLYVLSVVGDEYLAERYEGRLGKATVGKSCVKFKRLADADTDALAELLREAASHPPAGAA